MRFKKVLFVIPPFPGVNQSKDVLILGVGSLSQYLSDNGVENKVFDMRFGYSADDLKKCIEEYKPDLVGMQIMTYRHDVACDILNAIKSDKYSLIVGGHHVSTIDDQILNETPADFAIRLEGEDALLELCKGEPFKDIKNLSYRENGKVVKNPLRPFINDLDRLNFPRYEQFELSKYNSQIPIMTSRGCPFQCTFCPSAATIGRPFRVRSPKHVFDELKFWYDKGHKRFAFVDDNFTLIPKRVIELCSLIEKSDIKDLDIY